MEKRETSYTVSGNVKLVQPLWKTVWGFLRKLKIESSYDPATPFLGIYPGKTIIQKDICTLIFTSRYSRLRHGNNPNVHQQMNKMYMYTTEYYSGTKMIETMPSAAMRMNLEISY